MIAAVKDSGLRGRGGAGFPTGMKWGFIPQGDGKPHYLVVNADESEPGTCKDIPTMFATPHSLVEGAIIAAYAIRANHRLHLRAWRSAARGAPTAPRGGRGLRRRLSRHGTSWVRALTWRSWCTPGPARTSAAKRPRCLTHLKASEASRGSSRRSRPSRACTPARLWLTTSSPSPACRTIIERGASAFNALGTEKSKGFGIFSLSGHVTTPGQYEAPLGTTLRELLSIAGGVRSGHMLKFWTPGGSSTPILTHDHLDVPLDFESIGAAGSMLGTRALQIFDETTCVVRAVLRWMEFYEHESCGKCTPCREGTYWTVQVLDSLEHGQGSEADLGKLLDICDNITRPVVLRLRRRRDQPSGLLDQAFQG